MTPSRITGLVLVAAGLVLAASYLWAANLPLAIAGAFLTAFGLGWLAGPQRASAYPDHEPHLRHLWGTARRLPTDHVMTDPATGHRIRIERFRGFTTLAVADPLNPQDPDDNATLVTRYMLGFGRRPIPAPVFRHVTPIHDAPDPPKSWRQTRQALILADQTDAANTTLDELTERRAQFDRAVAAADEGQH